MPVLLVDSAWNKLPVEVRIKSWKKMFKNENDDDFEDEDNITLTQFGINTVSANQTIRFSKRLLYVVINRLYSMRIFRKKLNLKKFTEN